jgi:hypothetical protein
MRWFSTRPESVSQIDPQRQAGIRRSLRWMWLSYVPFFAIFPWVFFATSHWTGTRSRLLASSGAVILMAASSVLFLPFLRAVNPKGRLMGMSLVRYTVVSLVIGLAVAIGFSVAAFLS